MTDDTTRVLFCLIEGDSRPFKVTPNKGDIFDLKVLVQKRRKDSVLRNVDPNLLVLWKLHKPELAYPDNTLVERIKSRGADISQFADQLDTTANILDIFPKEVSDKHVHIVVRLDAKSFPRGAASDKDTDEEVNRFLEERRQSVNAFLRQTDLWPTWVSSSEDPRVADHITNLQIPLIDGVPKLLLHELGGDVVEKSIVEELFDPNAKNIRLINTSGSGKTRILLEGLCTEWGFYFTCAPSESLGSSDVAGSINDLQTTPGFTINLHPSLKSESPELSRNRTLARRQFHQVLTARIFVFRMFLEEARKVLPSGSLDQFRKHWLIFQLQSDRIVRIDIFRQLTRMLNMASEDYLGVDKLKLCKASTLVEDVNDKYLAGTTLYCVLDEGQKPAGLLKTAFRSEVNPSMGRSLLHEMILVWEILGSIILSGTGLSAKDVGKVVASRVAKSMKMEWLTLNHIGAFDSRQAQADYILRYLPPHIAESPSGQLLLFRAWSWLRGRYRFTASFLDHLVNDSFRSPHKLFDHYIVSLSGVLPSDTPEFAKDEPDLSVNTIRVMRRLVAIIDFNRLSKDADIAARFGSIICRWMLSMQTILLSEEEEEWVELGFARYRDCKAASGNRALVDEPLIIFAATTHLAGTPHGLLEHVLHGLDDAAGRGARFEEFLAVYFAHAFGPNVRLCDVFMFGRNIPNWAQKEGVELVALSSDGNHIVNYSFDPQLGPSNTLCRDLEKAEETVEWFKRPDTVMCFPDIHFGPDIVLFVRLPDARVICIIVQAKFRNKLSLAKADKEHAHSTLTPSKFYKNKKLTDAKWSGFRRAIRSSVGQLSEMNHNKWFPDKQLPFLRVVASFPADSSRVHSPDIALDMTRCKELMDRNNLLTNLTRRLKRSNDVEGENTTLKRPRKG